MFLTWEFECAVCALWEQSHLEFYNAFMNYCFKCTRGSKYLSLEWDLHLSQNNVDIRKSRNRAMQTLRMKPLASGS